MVKIISSETVYNGHFKIKKYTIDDNGVAHVEECFERGHSVAAIVFDSVKGKFLLTKQYRIGSQSELIEIAAGSMDKENESPEDAIKREIAEELGYEVDELMHITSAYVSPGGTSEKMHLFFALVSKQNSEGGGVEGENISTVEMSPIELNDFLNKTEDAKTYIAISWVINQSLKITETNTL